MERMQLLEDALQAIETYTLTEPWRPGLVDLVVYNLMIHMHEADYDNETGVPDYIWRDTPDHIMQYIIDNRAPFDLEYGLENLDEEIRDYLITNNFIVDPMDESVTDEEYTNNLEKEI